MDGDIQRRFAEWLIGRDTGLSSVALGCFMLGARSGRLATPWDEDDAGRCRRLLSAIPEWKPRLSELAEFNEAWRIAIDRFKL